MINLKSLKRKKLTIHRRSFSKCRHQVTACKRPTIVNNIKSIGTESLYFSAECFIGITCMATQCMLYCLLHTTVVDSLCKTGMLH